jgi:hypothetical protein
MAFNGLEESHIGLRRRQLHLQKGRFGGQGSVAVKSSFHSRKSKEAQGIVHDTGVHPKETMEAATDDYNR